MNQFLTYTLQDWRQSRTAKVHSRTCWRKTAGWLKDGLRNTGAIRAKRKTLAVSLEGASQCL
jgi:hypothetical protein